MCTHLGPFVSEFLAESEYARVNTHFQQQLIYIFKTASKVFEGLQQFFLVAHYAKYEVSMPSKVVDDAWHQFILFTGEYTRFCKEAFGDYFHHKPYPKNEEIEESDTIPISLLRTWALACRLEGIDPKQPDKLPLLFSLDAELKIENGNLYTLDSEKFSKEMLNQKNLSESSATFLEAVLKIPIGLHKPLY